MLWLGGLRRRHRRTASGRGPARGVYQDADDARGREALTAAQALIQRKDSRGAASYTATRMERVPKRVLASPAAPLLVRERKKGRRVVSWA